MILQARLTQTSTIDNNTTSPSWPNSDSRHQPTRAQLLQTTATDNNPQGLGFPRRRQQTMIKASLGSGNILQSRLPSTSETDYDDGFCQRWQQTTIPAGKTSPRKGSGKTLRENFNKEKKWRQHGRLFALFFAPIDNFEEDLRPV